MDMLHYRSSKVKCLFSADIATLTSDIRHLGYIAVSLDVSMASCDTLHVAWLFICIKEHDFISSVHQPVLASVPHADTAVLLLEYKVLIGRKSK